ncbi:hypothetical protein [Chelativorans intermedius]|uniref:Transcriptional regulator n=1 Tax=Chelativorans intermedius TaxID=515947 RepID=A0ABV6D7K7_9HYPH|nr:hypothetical protein [Chelativorans intermedius]MCT8999227.1 hypothetical protein [Chelativorans intermedius]
MAGIPISVTFLPDDCREALISRARQNAQARGISDAQWQRWRKGRGLGPDLLMALDPDRESALVKRGGKRR